MFRWPVLQSASFVQVTIGDYIQRTSVSNFRNSWEALDPGLEKMDEYGLGARESLQEAVKAVITTLGMQPVEVSGTNISRCRLPRKKCSCKGDTPASRL